MEGFDLVAFHAIRYRRWEPWLVPFVSCDDDRRWALV